MSRTILHSDMNCFYASVEMLHHPELAGKPMAVGGDPEARHGIVLTANYIAKRAGVKTGMALWQARQVCPEIIFVPPRMDLYYILVSVNGEQSDISTTKTGSTKIYNAKDIVEAGRIIELLKEQGIVHRKRVQASLCMVHRDLVCMVWMYWWKVMKRKRQYRLSKPQMILKTKKNFDISMEA